jgi:flagellar basal-body rod protein FlgF
MPKGIYAAASAMVVETRAQEINARNLANQQTAGYREETMRRTSFAQQLSQFGNNGDLSGDGGAGVLPNGSFFNFSDGSLEPTAAPLDMALRGNGFFRVRDGNNQNLLTRAGHFSLNEQSQLVTQEGWTVEGQGGAVVIPPNTERIVIGNDGTVTAEVKEGGARTQIVVDRLRLMTVADRSALIPMNGQYFAAGNQTEIDAQNCTVMQNHLEKANFQPLEQLVDMIAVQRRYDAAQKALKEQSQLGGSLSDLLRGG